MIKVLLTEDHVIVRNGIKLLLEGQPAMKVIAEAANGLEALALIESGIDPELLITDINMPNMDGISLIEEAKLRKPDMKAVVLSMLGSEEYIMRAFKAGCDGYLMKNVDEDELIFGLKKICSGMKYLCTELSQKFWIQLGTGEQLLPKEDQERPQLELSSREIEVLHLLAQGYTNQEMADKIFLSKRTVEGHRQALIDKTGSKNTAALIRFAAINGYLD